MRAEVIFIFVFTSIMVGVFLERMRAQWVRLEWRKKNGRPTWSRTPSGYKKAAASSNALPTNGIDAADQLRLVMDASFKKQRLLSRSESRVFAAVEEVIEKEKLPWRVMAQVNLGEILSSPDGRAYSAINSKRVDLLIIESNGYPLAAIEYQGEGHYQSSAAARDAVKKEALRKAGIGYIEIRPEHGPADVAIEIARIAAFNRPGNNDRKSVTSA